MIAKRVLAVLIKEGLARGYVEEAYFTPSDIKYICSCHEETKDLTRMQVSSALLSIQRSKTLKAYMRTFILPHTTEYVYIINLDYAEQNPIFLTAKPKPKPARRSILDIPNPEKGNDAKLILGYLKDIHKMLLELHSQLT